MSGNTNSVSPKKNMNHSRGSPMRSSMQHLPRVIHDSYRGDDEQSQMSIKKPKSSRGHTFNNEAPSLLNQSNMNVTIMTNMNERDVEMDNLKTIIIALN